MTNSVDAQIVEDRCVRGVVRFFNAGKGYGMVSILNNEAWDAFLHCTTLQRDDQPVPASGDVIECEVEMKLRGPEVVRVVKVRPQKEGGYRSPWLQKSLPEAAKGPKVVGEVKFFNFEKSFGFLTTEHGDVFLHITTLSRAGIPGAFAGDKFICETMITDKGLQAVKVEKTE